MSSDEQSREALEKLFPKPFTEYQWSALVSQGYEEAIRTGARSAEEVAQELKELMAAAGEARDAKASEPAAADSPALTWDQMEKLVLGRVLASEAPSRSEAVTSRGATRTHRRKESRRRAYRRWRMLTVICLVVAAAVVALLLIDPWDDGNGASNSALAAASPASTETTQDPAVVVGSTTSTALSTSTTATTTLVEVVWPYTAQLSGADAVPKVETQATGTLTLTVAPDRASVHVVFTVSNLEDITIARLRQGKAGRNGKVILTVRDGLPIHGLFSGLVVEGDFTADDLVGPLEGKAIEDLVALIEAGSVYCNVGTSAHARGEIRGQLE